MFEYLYREKCGSAVTGGNEYLTFVQVETPPPTPISPLAPSRLSRSFRPPGLSRRYNRCSHFSLLFVCAPSPRIHSSQSTQKFWLPLQPKTGA
jgi:hypothetical protein